MTGSRTPSSPTSALPPVRVSSRTPAVPLPAAARALSPSALEAALHGAAPATLVAAQEVTAGPTRADAGRAGLAPEPSDPASEVQSGTAPVRALREQLLAGEGVAQLLLFRVGRELFGVGLGCVEEAVELEAVSPVAGMPNGMLGVVRVRDRLLPLYSPAGALGVAPGAPAVALVARSGDRRVALAVDDVLDVLDVASADVRPAPGDGDDVLGVVRSGDDLVTVLEWGALVAQCLADQSPETA
jgi:purine-binding chemotaxis protein CheW